MKLHFGRPKDEAEASRRLPAGVPPAWQIDLWKKRQPKVDDRPQPRVEIDDFPYGWKPEEKREEPERGVCIIQL